MSADEKSPACFRIHAGDNVATMLTDADSGAEVQVLGEGGVSRIHVTEAIHIGHKIALADMRAGEPIVKYGFPIGEATEPIEPGAWIHLHNCRSLYDARSSELDLESGSRTETRYV